MSVTLHHGNGLQVINEIGECDMIFADPPDNIGLKYKGFDDKQADEDYYNLIEATIHAMYTYAPISWMSFNAKHMAMVGEIVNSYRGWDARFLIQTFTFGNNQRQDFVNGYRPLLRLMRPGAKTYPEAVYIPSWRQLNGDKRASGKGKMPNDYWEFPRVTGNSKQRRAWSPTQLHEGLYERCLQFSCESGSKVCDLYAGSGTLGRVAGLTHDVHLIELSDETATNIYEEHQCDLYCYLDSCPSCL